MKIVYSDRHRRHSGNAELNRGKLVPCFEKPERADIIHRHVATAGLGGFTEPDVFGVDPILRVHNAAYVAFLENAYPEWRKSYGDYDALPFTWVGPGMRRLPPDTLEGKICYYSFDAGTPLTAGTWEAVLSSVDTALTTVKAVHEGDRLAFGLCRPPGHHAGSDFYGGYCYLNNIAIAAQWLRDQGHARVAILDVDYHHGNGTQQIFYGRDDVLFVSLHADPRTDFPHFSGYADETGEGAGAGFNVNMPLPRGTDWDHYAQALTTALQRIEAYQPDIVLVSFGADTFEGDPISSFLLGHGDFRRMGEQVATLSQPMAVLMEGGYAVEDLGVNTVHFLTGLAAVRGQK